MVHLLQTCQALPDELELLLRRALSGDELLLLQPVLAGLVELLPQRLLGLHVVELAAFQLVGR